MDKNKPIITPIPTAPLPDFPLSKEQESHYSKNFTPTVIWEGIRVRNMSTTDLQLVIGWAIGEGWNPGLHEIDALYAADPNGYHLLEVDGKPVASLAVVRYSQQFAFLGLYIVEQAHRKQGYGKLLWDSVMRNIPDYCCVGLNSVGEQVEQYRKEGFNYANTNTRWQGNLLNANLSIEKTTSVSIRQPNSIASLIHYNSPLFPAPRAAFLSQWLSMPFSHVLAAFDNDKLCGYGVICKTSDGYKIAPLLADNHAIAEHLYLALCQCVGSEGSVFIDTTDNNPDAMFLIQKLGLKKCFDTFRMYKGQNQSMDDSKWFGLNSLEIG